MLVGSSMSSLKEVLRRFLDAGVVWASAAVGKMQGRKNRRILDIVRVSRFV